MKLTVNKNLNARTGAPLTTAPNPYYREPGQVLEIDNPVVGTSIDGNAIWYHCTDDNQYYWSGGFEEEAFVLGDTQLNNYTQEEQVEILMTFLNDKRLLLGKTASLYKGIGYGNKNGVTENGLAITVYVTEKEPVATIPTYFNYRGIQLPTDICETGADRRFGFWDGGPPYQLGGSIGREGMIDFGTRTLKVTKDNKIYVLGCFHVLLPDLQGEGYYDYNPHDDRKAIYPFGSVPPGKTFRIQDGIYNNEFDYAVALLPAADAPNLHNVVGNGRVPVKNKDIYTKDDQKTSKGRKIIMHGTVTSDAQGEIVTPYTSMQIGNDPFETIEIIVTTPIATFGDSGAPVIDEENNKLVGYVIGGSDTQTYIMPYYKLRDTLHYTIV